MAVQPEKRRIGQIGGHLVPIILGSLSEGKLNQEWHQIGCAESRAVSFPVYWMNGGKRGKIIRVNPDLFHFPHPNEREFI